MHPFVHEHTHIHKQYLTLAPVSPGVHPPAKLASQMGPAAKTGRCKAAVICYTEDTQEQKQTQCGEREK